MVQPHQVRPCTSRRWDTNLSSYRWFLHSVERQGRNDTDMTKRWVCSWWRWYLYSLCSRSMSTKAFIKSLWLEKEYREFARLRERKRHQRYYIERKVKLMKSLMTEQPKKQVPFHLVTPTRDEFIYFEHIDWDTYKIVWSDDEITIPWILNNFC